MARESSMMLLPTRSRTASIVFASGMCFDSISQRSAPSLSGIEKGSRSRVVAIFRTHVAILPPSSGESHKLDHPIDFLPPYQKFESTSLQQTVRVSADFALPGRKAGLFRGCAGAEQGSAVERDRRGVVMWRPWAAISLTGQISVPQREGVGLIMRSGKGRPSTVC